ncbi:hypothetical protein [Emcibacter sp. SYSU 3D8]|uniref:hypothetical protein n=1 Tax=Emcibacter sp. SYSU 3D8 TaxID=3133969 RepID=UPI0031FEE4DC
MVRTWWMRVRQCYLPVSDTASRHSREDGRAEFEAMNRLTPILAEAGAAYVALLERQASDTAADNVLIEAAATAGVASRALRLIPAPRLRSAQRQEYVAGVFAYAEALIAATERQTVISRQIRTARTKKDLATELLLASAQDQILIDLLARENVFQHAAADAIRTANPQYFLTRARAELNSAMIRLLERPDAAGQSLEPAKLAAARRAIDKAEGLLRKAAASAPRYYDWLRRHEDPSGLANTAPMRTAMGALKKGLEDSIATERAIASGARALADAVDGAPSLAMRLGHGPHPHVTIASLVVRRLAPAQTVRKS